VKGRVEVDLPTRGTILKSSSTPLRVPPPSKKEVAGPNHSSRWRRRLTVNKVLPGDRVHAFNADST